jgi:FkbM family methyltransferase
VIDAGANHGEFASECHAAFGCEPLLLEANPSLAHELARSLPFRICHCALADRDGTVPLNVAHNDEGSSLLTLPFESPYASTLEMKVDVPARTLADVISSCGADRVALLKLDIEGAETRVILTAPSATLRAIDQLTVEFHSDPSFGFDLADEVRKTIRRLRREGFAVLVCEPRLRDVLFVNTTSVRLSCSERMGLYAAVFQARCDVRVRVMRTAFWRTSSRVWCMLPYATRQRIKRVLGVGQCARASRP